MPLDFSGGGVAVEDKPDFSTGGVAVEDKPDFSGQGTAVETVAPETPEEARTKKRGRLNLELETLRTEQAVADAAQPTPSKPKGKYDYLPPLPPITDEQLAGPTPTPGLFQRFNDLFAPGPLKPQDYTNLAPSDRAKLDEARNRLLLGERISRIEHPISEGTRESIAGGVRTVMSPAGLAVAGAAVVAPEVVLPALFTKTAADVPDVVSKVLEHSRFGSDPSRADYYKALGDAAQTGLVLAFTAGPTARVPSALDAWRDSVAARAEARFNAARNITPLPPKQIADFTPESEPIQPTGGPKAPVTAADVVAPMTAEALKQAGVPPLPEIEPIRGAEEPAAARPAGEVPGEAQPEALGQGLKPDWKVIVQAPRGEDPGYVQIVDPSAPETSGAIVPPEGSPDFSKLPTGSYTVEEATKMLAEAPKAEPAAPKATPVSDLSKVSQDDWKAALKNAPRVPVSSDPANRLTKINVPFVDVRTAPAGTQVVLPDGRFGELTDRALNPTMSSREIRMTDGSTVEFSQAFGAALSAEALAKHLPTEAKPEATPAKPATKEPWQETVYEYEARRLLSQATKDEKGQSVFDISAWTRPAMDEAMQLRDAFVYSPEGTSKTLVTFGPNVSKEMAASLLVDALKQGDGPEPRSWSDHAEQVERAIKSGKPVPPAVLADYPDLKAKAAPEAAPAPETKPPAKEPWQMTRDEFASSGPHDTNVRIRETTGATTPSELLKYYQGKYPELAGVTIGGWKATKESGPLKNTGVARIVLRGGKLIGAESQIHLSPDADLTVTRHEIEHLLDVIHGRNLEGKQEFSRFRHDRFNESDYLHRSLVKQALREGKAVPPEVLADYPDLQSKPGPQAPAPAGPVAPVPEIDPQIADIIHSPGGGQAKAAQVAALARERGMSVKQMQEAVEVEIVKQAHRIALNPSLAPLGKFTQLLDLYNKQPTLSARTSTSIDEQAYSTPAPLAHAMSHATGVTPATAVYDATGGNGMLLIGSDLKAGQANELNIVRAVSLRRLGVGTVTEHDATQYTPTSSFPVVHLNPPFGSIDNVKYAGFGIKRLEHIIALRALEALQDDGVGMMILGARREEGPGGKGAQWVFENYLYGHYNVVANFEVAGDLYAKQGAKWPVRVIVVAGRRQLPIGGELAPAVVERKDNWNDVWTEAERIRREIESRRSSVVPGTAQPGLPEPLTSRPAPAGQPGGLPATPSGPVPPSSVGGQRGGSGGRQPSPGPRPAPGDAGFPPDRPSDEPTNTEIAPPRQPDVGRKPAAPVEGGVRPDIKLPASAPTGGGGTGGAIDVGELPKPPVVKPPPSVETTEFQSTYEPRSQGQPFGTLTPKNIAEGEHAALDKLIARVGPIDEFVANRMNMEPAEVREVMAAEQIDGVALAIDQIENGGALIIGDETGIGKGRQGAAVIRYAILNGKIPIFFTKDPKLFSDMYGDLVDIHTQVKPFILGDTVKASIVDQEGKIVHRSPGGTVQKREMQNISDNGMEAAGYNAIFVTYSQVNTRNARQLFLEQLTAENPSIVILDESHEAAGDAETSMQSAFMSGGTIKRGSGANQTTVTVPGLLRQKGTLHGEGGVLYMSATYAKRPENMPVYFRTSLSRSAQSFSQIVDAMKRGGVALQQAVSEALAKVGQYIRRERDFTGVKFDVKQLQAADPTKLVEDIDEVTDVLSEIVRFSQEMRSRVKESTAQSETAISMTDFASVVHNQISQLLLAAKADHVIAEAIAAKQRREKPVLTMMNTMESFLDHYTNDKGTKPGDTIKLRWNELLKHALERTLRQSEEQPNGDTIISYVDPDTVGLGDYYRQIQALADGIESNFPISPIDYILQKLNKAGVRMVELTGRSSGIEYTNFETGEGIYRKFKPANKNRVVNGFNNGDYDGMLMNASGSTGLSAHASVKFKSKEPRHMVTVQPALDINVFMQTLGRIKRTGMVSQGTYPDGTKYGARYTYVTLPLQAEIRPAAMASRKMKSLNANTTAESGGAVKIQADDIYNKYGDLIVSEYLDDHPEVQRLLGLGIDHREDGSIIVERDTARKFTGRQALMPNADQETAYNEILPAYRNLIEQLKTTGDYDLEIVVHDDWKGVRQSDAELAAGTDQSNIFTAGLRLQQWEVSDNRHVPTGAEMLAEFKRRLGSPEKAKEWEKTQTKLDAMLEKRIDALRQQSLEAKDADKPKIERQLDAALETQTRWEATKAGMNDLLDAPGRVIELSNAETGDTYEGILTDVTFPTNRTAKSAFRFRFMVDDPTGTIYLTGSDLLQGKWSIGYSGKELSDFTGASRGARITRYFVTGNPIQGFAATGGHGKMTRFKSNEGQVITGLMMPRNWGPGNLVSDPRLELVSGQAVAHFLREHGGSAYEGYVSVEVGGIARIRKAPNGSYLVSVPSARKTGGSIYLDDALRALTGDFTKYGNRMTVPIEESKLPAVADRISAIVKARFRPVGRSEVTIPQVSAANQRAGGPRPSSSGPVGFFPRRSEAQGLGEPSTPPTVEDVRRQRSLQSPPAQEAGNISESPTGMWVSPDGVITPVRMFEHEFVAKRLLGEDFNPDKGVPGYQLDKKRYARGVFDRKTNTLLVDASQRLTNAARRAIKDYAIEHGVNATFGTDTSLSSGLAKDYIHTEDERGTDIADQPRSFFNRRSEAQGLGEPSMPPTVHDVRRQRLLDREGTPVPPDLDTPTPPPPPPPAAATDLPDEPAITDAIRRQDVLPGRDWMASPEFEFRKNAIASDLVTKTVEAELGYQAQVSRDIERFNALKRGLTMPQQIQVTRALRAMQNGNPALLNALPPAERTAADAIRAYFDEVKRVIIKARQQDLIDAMPEAQGAAVHDIIHGNLDEEEAFRLHRLRAPGQAAVRAALAELDALEDWGPEDYVTNIERGSYRIVTPDGTTVAIAETRTAARDKALRYAAEHPGTTHLTITDEFSTNAEFPTKLSRGQYFRMAQRAADALGTDVREIQRMLRAAGSPIVVIKPPSKFAGPMQHRRNVLKGEDNIFDALPAYSYSIRKKLALDPVFKEARTQLPNLPENMRNQIEELLGDVRGRYSLADQIADYILYPLGQKPFAFSRGVNVARQITATLKLGYRPITAIINRLGGLQHTWTKTGTKYWNEGRVFRSTPEFQEIWRRNADYMGATAQTFTEGSRAGETPWWHPLSMFQYAERVNRPESFAAFYKYAEGELGLSGAEAEAFARNAGRFGQFTYTVASLPRILRNPVGRLVGQFKAYMVKEMEFVSSLRGYEIPRYLTAFLLMGGPRACIYMLRSLPFLGAIGALWALEDWLNRKLPRASRGLPGFAGIDVTAAVTPQLPSQATDWMGPTLSDMWHLWDNVIRPAMQGERRDFSDIKQWGTRLAPAMLYWARLLEAVGDKQGWITDDRGRPVYKPKAGGKVALALGAKPLEQSVQELNRAYLDHVNDIAKKNRARLLDDISNAITKQDGATLNKLLPQAAEYGIDANAIRNAVKQRMIDADQRQQKRLLKSVRGQEADR